MSLYRDYYAKCRSVYPDGGKALGLYALGVHVVLPGATEAGLIGLGDQYLAAVSATAAETDRRIVRAEGIYRNPDAQVRGLAIQLEPFWDFEPLETIAATLLPQVELNVLGCFGVVNQVNIIRTVPSERPPASSWLWHYDNKPDEAFKILIYLTDVSATSGAFEYLCHELRGDVPKVKSSRVSPDVVMPPRWPHSRVPRSALDEYQAAGYQPQLVCGPLGTTILFDNNCIHRATVPVAQHRDALILNIRPSHCRIRPFVSRTHTGSWSFNVKQWIPELLDIGVSQ